MIRLLLPVNFHLPFYDLMVRSSGVIIGQYGPPSYWSICKRQVGDRLAFLVLPFPMVGGPAVSTNLPSVPINLTFPECSIPLNMASCVPSFAVGVEVFSEDSPDLPNDWLPVQLSRCSRSRPHIILIVNIDNPRDLFTSPPDVGTDNIVSGPSAQIRPLINNQASPLPYRGPNCFSFAYFVCRMADPNLSS